MRDDDAARQQDESAGVHGGGRASRWEWGFAVGSAVLVAAMTGFMLYQALTQPTTPPQITLVVDSIIPNAAGYVVEFTAANRGTTTAAQLGVRGELSADTGLVETSSATLDYVPAQGRRSGGLFFSRDPSRFRLQLRPTGYARP